MPAVTWGIQADCDAAQDFLDASQYAYEFVNVGEQAGGNASANGEAPGSAEM